MATIADLATLAPSGVGSGDYLPISDSGTDKKIDATLVPWTSTPSVFTDSITVPAIRTSGANVINDDAMISFTPDKVSAGSGFYPGLLFIWSRFAGQGNRTGIVAFRSGTNPFCTLLADGGTLAVTTGALTGTTGTDGKLNVSAATDNKIYIENRTGAQVSIAYLIVG